MTAQVPVRERKTGRILFALVDDADYPSLSRKAWRLRKGYAVARFSVYRPGRNDKKQEIPMHRLVLGLSPGDPREGDHKNRDRLDNRRDNLRIATRAQNAQNLGHRRRWGKHGKDSGIRGVYWHEVDAKWMAVVGLNGRNRYLGTFDDPAEAGRVASEFRARHMPYAIEAGKGGASHLQEGHPHCTGDLVSRTRPQVFAVAIPETQAPEEGPRGT